VSRHASELDVIGPTRLRSHPTGSLIMIMAVGRRRDVADTRAEHMRGNTCEDAEVIGTDDIIVDTIVISMRPSH
jgi:hypothetical protein